MSRAFGDSPVIVSVAAIIVPVIKNSGNQEFEKMSFLLILYRIELILTLILVLLDFL